MPAPTRLSPGQWGHIAELKKYAKSVYVDGYDLANALVVTRTDAKGTAQYAIREDGSGRPPIQPVVPFTIEDLYEFPERHYNLIQPLTDTKEGD